MDITLNDIEGGSYEVVATEESGETLTVSFGSRTAHASIEASEGFADHMEDLCFIRRALACAQRAGADGRIVFGAQPEPAEAVAEVETLAQAVEAPSAPVEAPEAPEAVEVVEEGGTVTIAV